MTASRALQKDVREAIAGVARGSALGVLKNFKKTGDNAGVASAASLSTKAFVDTRTLAASATENLDLAGALVGIDGATLTFTKIHAIFVRPAPENTNDVVLGGGANPFLGPFSDATDKVKVGPGNELLFSSKVGWNVTAATADILLVANSAAGTAVTYDIVIIGE